MSKAENLKSDILNLKSTYTIIVAGGSGARMRSVVPKQFLSLNGLPVLMHTLLTYSKSVYQPQLILVLPNGYHDYWKQLCLTHNFNLPHALVTGGETRFHSVKAAFDTITNKESIVAVHDAVRPLTSTTVIDGAYLQAAQKGNAITAVKSRDSIRQLKEGVSVNLARDEIYLVQTPQTFQHSQLEQAYLQAYDPHFTDDASVVEKAGFVIHLINGDHQNIKITFPEDIAIAELILNNRSKEQYL